MLSIVYVCPGVHVWEWQEKNNLLDRTEAGTGQLKIFPQPLGVVLSTHHGMCSLTDYTQSVPYKDKLPQRAAVPLFDGVCPPVLYSRPFSKAQGIKMCCRSLPYTIWETFPSARSFCFSWHRLSFNPWNLLQHSPKGPRKNIFPVTPQSLTVVELTKFIARFPSGVGSSSKTCQYLVIHMQQHCLQGFTARPCPRCPIADVVPVSHLVKICTQLVIHFSDWLP